MKLEEAVALYKEESQRNKADYELNNQIYEWLKELQAYRSKNKPESKQPHWILNTRLQISKAGIYKCSECKIVDKVNELVNAVNKLVSKAEEKETKWIPVSERLPENNDLILLNLKCKIEPKLQLAPTVGMFLKSYKQRKDVFISYPDHDTYPVGKQEDDRIYVNAWMPLPERYEEDEVKE